MRTPGFIGTLLAIGVCACSEVRAAYRDVLIQDVPHVRQKPDFCGEACAEMALRKLGHDINQDAVFNRAGLDPALGRGCHTAELAKALRDIGFKVGPVWNKVRVVKLASEMESRWKALHTDLTRGVPSIVCMRYNDRPNATEHFRLVLGYSAAREP